MPAPAREVEPREIASDESIGAAAAAELLGLPGSSFNASRRAMQLVRDRATGRVTPYPDFTHDALGNTLSHEERRRREIAFDSANILVVPEWGGIKFPRGSWSYSRRRCEAIRDQRMGVCERMNDTRRE